MYKKNYFNFYSMNDKKKANKLYKCDSYYPFGGSLLSIDFIIALFTLILTNTIKYLSNNNYNDNIISKLNLCLIVTMISNIYININLHSSGKPMLCFDRNSLALNQMISLFILINSINSTSGVK